MYIDNFNSFYKINSNNVYVNEKIRRIYFAKTCWKIIFVVLLYMYYIFTKRSLVVNT